MKTQLIDYYWGQVYDSEETTEENENTTNEGAE